MGCGSRILPEYGEGEGESDLILSKVMKDAYNERHLHITYLILPLPLSKNVNVTK